ncbi:MAG: PPXXXP-CTERM sorting domain-containing NosD-like protein, partial [Thermoplasmata archaeon]|nr:PPXXXP-CTERM sorting domain-containing NosD-like protein [Thermoplasmata archaeon]
MKDPVPPMKITMCFILVFVCAFLCLLAIEEAEAKTITVDDDGGANYTKIQDAIDAAEDGDTIRVYEGTYSENVVVNKTVSLIGNGSANTTIDGGGNGNVVQITRDWVNMSGFNVTGSGNDWNNIGINIKSNNNKISNNNCFNNRIGIHASRSNNCIITNNTC